MGGNRHINGKAFASASLSTLQTSNTWIIQWKDRQQQMSRDVIIRIPLCDGNDYHPKKGCMLLGICI